MKSEKIILSILSVLISISLFLSTYVFNSMEKRLSNVEIKADERIERIAILEQQARENSQAHSRIEAKVDTLLTVVIRK